MFAKCDDFFIFAKVLNMKDEIKYLIVSNTSF